MIFCNSNTLQCRWKMNTFFLSVTKIQICLCDQLKLQKNEYNILTNHEKNSRIRITSNRIEKKIHESGSHRIGSWKKISDPDHIESDHEKKLRIRITSNRIIRKIYGSGSHRIGSSEKYTDPDHIESDQYLSIIGSHDPFWIRVDPRIHTDPLGSRGFVQHWEYEKNNKKKK